MFTIARLLVLIIVFIPIYSCGAFKDNNGLITGNIDLNDGNADTLVLGVCQNCKEYVRADRMIDAGDYRVFCKQECFINKHSSLALEVNNFVRENGKLRNDISLLKQKNEQLIAAKNNLDSKIKELEEKIDNNAIKDPIISLCVNGLCAAYVYEHMRFHGDEGLFLRIFKGLVVSGWAGAVASMSKDEYSGRDRRLCRGVAWAVVGASRLEKPGDTGPDLVNCLPALMVFAGPVIIDQIGTRVDHYLEKKKIHLPFDVVGIAGTIAMIHLADLPWAKMAALLMKK